EHAAYWHGLELREYLGGPFADRSGGLVSFETDSHDDAAQIVADDPFVREGLVECSWVKEWKVE
ncbi:MAG: YciI family protein, partial [Solirubrobacteraceae bacterium]